jgi:crotonobetainyl-CoA:carnitine CoA-transferase CaiB-like acyl-CoA transferase
VPQQTPLAVIHVVEFGHFVAAPGAAMLLAEVGADVLKVESLQGDSARDNRAMFLTFNRSKRSIALDLT